MSRHRMRGRVVFDERIVGPVPKVVVGGGMVGVACAHELGRKDIDMVLVDRHDYVQFQPLPYQVASSQCRPGMW